MFFIVTMPLLITAGCEGSGNGKNESDRTAARSDAASGKTSEAAKGSHLFEHHGTAASVGRGFGAAATANRQGQRLVMIWVGDHSEGARRKFVVNIDTGAATEIQVDLPVWDTARGVYLSSRNLWYANFAHRFYEFDPDALEFSHIAGTEGRRSYALTEDRHGRIWGAQNPDMQLIRFDPETREIVDFGQINHENWPQYARTIAIDEQGWIYAGIGAVKAQIIGFQPETGEIKSYIPDDKRQNGSGRVIRGTDNRVYAHAPGVGWHLLANGDAVPIDSMPVDPAPIPAGYHSTAVDRFPDGSRISLLDVPNRTLIVEEVDGSLREVTLDYDTPGARIYSMALGSDGAIYGGTGQPTHVFRFDPMTGKLTEKHLYPGNHLNAMITRGDLIYAAHYSGARIYSYDITRPWMPDDPENPNPAALPGDALPELRRPAVLAAYPDGRHLIMGGTPRGGRSAGGLYIYDLQNMEGEIIPHQDLVENLSTKAIIILPDGNLLGAASARPGTGGEKVADEAELYIMDWKTRNVLWHDVILPGREELPDMIEGPDGLVYGIADDATLFVFEPETRKVIHEESLAHYGLPAGSQAPRIMASGPDGTIYILFRNAIISLEPRTFEHSKLADSPVVIETGIVIHDGRLYFSTMTDLWSIQIKPSNQ